MAKNKKIKKTPENRPQAQRVKDYKKTVKSLIKLAKNHLLVIIAAVCFAIGSSVLTLFGPNKIGDLTNLISEGMFAVNGIDMSAILSLAVMLLTIYALSGILNYIQSFLMVDVTVNISKNLRKDISAKINKLPLKYLDSMPYGDVLSRVTNDVDTVGQSLSNSITTLISNAVLLIGCIIMMFISNWIMAITAIISSLIGFVIMFVIMMKSQKYFIMQQKSLGDINAHIEENYTNHIIVKTYNGQDDAAQTFEKHNKKLNESAWKSQFLSGLMMPLMNFIGNIGYVAVCVVGAVLCAGGHIEIGVIVSFIIYLQLFRNPLINLAQAFASLQSAIAAGERVFEFLDEKELAGESHIKKSINVRKVKGNVEFKNVKFGYDENKIIISDFSAAVKAGQKIAIVGPTGAGKTTLVNLLMRFYEINEGDILIDGISIRELTRENVHDLFGMVLQDTWIFEGTVRENLVYDNKNVSDEQVIEICKTVGIDHFIKTLPKGYDTVLDENTSISAGQKQLMTIARAMIQNSPMLILDEATSSVDTRTEIIIGKAMDKLTEGRTSFVIAHRLSTIKNADMILVMKDGNVIEQGTHNKLMKQQGFYFNLYNSQFTNKGAEVIEV